MRDIQITALEKYASPSAYEKVEDGVYKIISGERVGKFAMAFSFKREDFIVEGADENAIKKFSKGSLFFAFPKGSLDKEAVTAEVISASLEDLADWRKAVAGKRIYLKDAEEVWADYGYTNDDGAWVAEDRVPLIRGDLVVEDDKGDVRWVR